MKAVSVQTGSISQHIFELALWLGLVIFGCDEESAWADTPNTYPGVILSTSISGFGQVVLQDARKKFAIGGLSAERLNQRTLHINDRKITALQAGPVSGRKDLCRTAKVRRFIKELRGRIRCTQNFELTMDRLPNDPLYENYLWGLKTIGASTAWDVTTGNRDAIVAVIDTGISLTHPDLVNNLWSNSAEIPNNGQDDDANGYIDDNFGVNTITSYGSGFDDNGHGTHVAGTIGAQGDNSQGVAGVNWNVRLMAVKFLGSSGSGSTTNAIRSVEYVLASKLRGQNIVAINASWGGSSFSPPLFDSIKRAGDAGILFVAAAGNAASNNDLTPAYPASYSASNIISVASLDSTGTLSSFSNYGATSVHIAAPGRGIYSTWPSASYASLSGTSMASPHVAGVAALAYAACPSLGISRLKTVILTNGVATTNLVNVVSSGAYVSAALAVAAASSFCAQSDPTPTATPVVTATGTTTPTPVNPTITPTPENPTPTVAPTQTPIEVEPTPSPTPTPQAPALVAMPSTIPAATQTTLTIRIPNRKLSAVALKYMVYLQSGKAVQCPGSSVVAVSNGVRTIKLSLPAAARHFPRIDVSFQFGKARASAQINQTGTAPTNIPAIMAARLCSALTARR